MELRYDGSEWYCVSTYQERMIPKGAGFRWDGDRKRWHTPDVHNAHKLLNYATDSAKEAIDKFIQSEKDSITASRAKNADIDIPSPGGLNYYPYQKAGVAYAMDRESTIIADEMGLGKSIQSIGIVNLDKSIKKVLVICPASLKINWQREIETWLVRDLSVGIASTQKPWPDTDIVIINYDIIGKAVLKDYIYNTKWDLLVVDECHYLKSPKAQRTQAVLGGKKTKGISSNRKVFLTGTPILNRPIELWPILHSLDPVTWNSWFHYVTRYCDGYQTRYGWEDRGASNLEELQNKLRSTVMIRRRKAEVLPELPPKRRQVLEFPANGCLEAIQNEQNAYRMNQEEIERLRAQVEISKASDDPEVYQNAIDRLREGIGAAFTEMSRIRHETALAKIPYVIEHIKEVMETGEKVIVFCHHKDVVMAIADAIDGSVTVTGDTKLGDRQAAVDAFQKDDSVRVFVGTIGAAGVGITLTAASIVVFAELDWVPANITQAEDRAHRIGQQNYVLVQHLVFEQSLDATMARKLVEKQAVIDKALDTDPGEIQLEEPVIPIKDEDEPATKNSSRKDIEKEAENVSAEQISAIHEALKILAGMDQDYATGINQIGFNKIDTCIGHSLAEWHKLTPKQAVLGKKIVLKYHRQLPEELLEKIKG